MALLQSILYLDWQTIYTSSEHVQLHRDKLKWLFGRADSEITCERLALPPPDQLLEQLLQVCDFLTPLCSTFCLLQCLKADSTESLVCMQCLPTKRQDYWCSMLTLCTHSAVGMLAYSNQRCIIDLRIDQPDEILMGSNLDVLPKFQPRILSTAESRVSR